MPRTLFEHPVCTLEADTVTGRDGAQTEFLRLRMPDWVCVVAITEARELVMVRQPRFGVGADGLEPPGGLVDPGEKPVQAARRELREETGYEALYWEPLGVVHPNPALQDNRCWLFAARQAVCRHLPEPDAFEQITVELHSLDDLGDLLLEGKVTHACAVVALQRLLMIERDAPDALDDV